MSYLLPVLLTIAVTSAVATDSTAAAVISDHRDFSGQIDIGGGRRLYLSCKGRGSPTVILESGIHDSSDPWSITDTQPPVLEKPAVFLGVARFTRVCTYDRPGTIRYTNPIALTTRSTPVDGPRTLQSMVSDLHALLTRAGARGPYVLVAHSYGGLILRLFAQTDPPRRRVSSSSTRSAPTSSRCSAINGRSTRRS